MLGGGYSYYLDQSTTSYKLYIDVNTKAYLYVDSWDADEDYDSNEVELFAPIPDGYPAVRELSYELGEFTKVEGEDYYSAPLKLKWDLSTETDFACYEVWDITRLSIGYYGRTEDTLGNIIKDTKLATITDQGVGEYEMTIKNEKKYHYRYTYKFMIYSVNKIGQRTPSSFVTISNEI